MTRRVKREWAGQDAITGTVVGLASPFSQVSRHLLPFQTGDLHPLPESQG